MISIDEHEQQIDHVPEINPSDLRYSSEEHRGPRNSSIDGAYEAIDPLKKQFI